ncbi:MAG: tetratricopeptide repeat protein [Verrucomicrobia bacterium]|nr:tetratricopeptide repeat protein [Verrucomicrobiota bacterium]
MPIFGEFETVGESYAVTDKRNHTSTIWQARKIGGADSRLYAVKCFVPRRRQTEQEQPDEALERDRKLEFLEGIKQLKKAHSEGGRALTDVYDFGLSEEGAWYVTDFYPRNALKAWISRRGGVDHAALRHVVYSVVAGCLTLKRSCGRSHGNLKASNVFLMGKPRALRSTPLVLTDILPPSLAQATEPDAGIRRTVGGLIYEVMETHDLRAIGELILQLVEGRLIESGYDYNYPIVHSPSWETLGKEGERWRQICNQLLDPQLSLDKVNLESLAREFRPSPLAANLPLVIGAAGVVLVLGLGVFGIVQWRSGAKEKKYEAALAGAREALSVTNLVAARQQVEQALKLRREDTAAMELRQEIETRLESEFSSALALARLEADSANWDAALDSLKRALVLKPGDQTAKSLEAQTLARRDEVLTQEDRERRYQEAMNAGQVAFDRQDYTDAMNKADTALKLKPNDPAATTLRADAQARSAAATLAQQRQRQYETAMSEGRAALNRQQFAEAITKAEAALTLMPNDAAATKLKSDAQNQQAGAEAAEQERQRQYASAMKQARAAFDRKEYTNAVASADIALGFKPGDADATNLKAAARNQIQAAMTAEQQRQQRYDAAMSDGRLAFERKAYNEAMQKADEALAIKPNDTAATSLRTSAKAQYDAGEKLAREQQQRYETAMREGRAALDKKNFREAMTKADAALSAKADDAAATKLKADAKALLEDELVAAQQREQRYDAAMTEARTALRQQDYAVAISKADVALVNKPGDADALALRADAQKRNDDAQAAEQQRQQQYATAMKEGRAALQQGNFEDAIAKADSALTVRQGDPAAEALKADARKRHEAAIELAKRQQEQYDAAMQAGLAAFNSGEYATAARRATEAMARRSGDAGAAALKKRADDIQTAQTAFTRGDYDNALGVCEAHRGVPVFDALATSINSERSMFVAAGQKFSAGDYSFLEDLKRQTFAGKDAVKELVTKSESEQKTLTELRGLTNGGDWQAVQQRLTALASAGVLQKEPFAAVRQWAESQAAEENQQRSAMVAKLDAVFEVLLVQYNILNARDAKTSEGRSARRLGEVGFQQKDYDQKRVAALEQEYQRGGWLNEADRQRQLNILKERIPKY